MATSVRFAAKKDYRHYVDVSKFTEMEVEHSHDTSSQIDHSLQGHIHPSTIDKFRSQVDEKFGQVKSEALKWTERSTRASAATGEAVVFI